jgi:hypothetical protein
MAPSEVTDTSATMNASVEQNGAKCVAFFQYGDAAVNQGASSHLTLGEEATQTFTCKLSGLPSGSIYRYRAVVESGGAIYVGGEVQIITPQPPQAVIVDWSKHRSMFAPEPLEAFRFISQAYLERAGSSAQRNLGIRVVTQPGEYAKVVGDDVPILTEPYFRPTVLHVIGLAQASEYFLILSRQENPVLLTGPYETKPIDGGWWFKVQTKDGWVGWIQGAGLTIVTFRAPGPSPEEVAKERTASTLETIFVVGISVVLLVIVRGSLTSSKKAPVAGGSYSGDSSYDGGSYEPVESTDYSPSEDSDDSNDTSNDSHERTEDSDSDRDHHACPPINFSVRIVNEDGDGVEGIDVFVRYIAMGENVSFSDDSGETDSDGWIHFTKEVIMSFGVRARINVKGEEYDEDVEDGDSFSYTI